MTVHADWPIPSGLAPAGRTAAEAITRFLVDNAITSHYSGGRFYTPQEWADRGEQWGREALLIITHDGGDHAPAFNYDYEQDDLREGLRAALAAEGLYLEQFAQWCSGVYPI